MEEISEIIEMKVKREKIKERNYPQPATLQGDPPTEHRAEKAEVWVSSSHLIQDTGVSLLNRVALLNRIQEDTCISP